jgi:hypothetical protein
MSHVTRKLAVFLDFFSVLQVGVLGDAVMIHLRSFLKYQENHSFTLKLWKGFMANQEQV